MRQIVIASLIFLIAAAGFFLKDAAAEPQTNAARDVLLMLDSGLLHLRFHIRLQGKSVEESREKYLEEVIAELDFNKDGSVTRQETFNSPLFNARKRISGNPFVASLGENQKLTRRDIRLNIERIGGAMIAYRQDESPSEYDLEVFKVIDKDGSGRIDRAEMRTASARLAALDKDRDQCIGFDEFLSKPEQPTGGLQATLQNPESNRPRPKPAFSEIMRDVRDPLLPRRIVRKYDQNRDGQLTAKELGWTKKRLDSLDQDKDDVLTSRELTQIADSPVDLELAIELSGKGDGEALRIVSSASERQIPAPRPDLVILKFGETTVTFSYRNVDPIQSAIDNAMRTFNQLDLDTNGYIDRNEIKDRFRFERYLFEAIDGDNDQKVFAKEMREYIAVRGRPAATSCQVNLYNTGNGFFQMLDTSGDGRISIRELRNVEKSMIASVSSPGAPLTPRETGQHYHIEFVRGSYQLFGRSERMLFQGPTFIQRPPIGPIWFQRMDRNSDGDLTWKEFLGPREAFHALDVDQDGLIDHREALRGDKI